jgi:hypothetical protein
LRHDGRSREREIEVERAEDIVRAAHIDRQDGAIALARVVHQRPANILHLHAEIPRRRLKAHRRDVILDFWIGAHQR